MKEIKNQLKGIFPDLLIGKLVDYLLLNIIRPAVLLDDISDSKSESDPELEVEVVKFELPKISPNSCNYLHYQVYPFIQGREKSKRHFGIDWHDCVIVEGEMGENYSQAVIFPNVNDFPELEFFYYEYAYLCNQKILYVGGINKATLFSGIVYVIADQSNHILSSFRDVLYDYQLGDSQTFVYIWNKKDLVVENIGDVSSMVIIKDYSYKN